MKLCRNVRKWISLSILLALTVCALPGTAARTSESTNGAETNHEDADAAITALRAEIETLRAKQRALDEQIEAQKESVAGVCLQKMLMDQKLALLASEVNCFDRMIACYDRLIARQENEQQELQTAYAAEFQVLAERLRQTYEEGMPGLLEQFSRADSLLSLLVGLERNGQIKAYDRALMESLEAKLQTISTLRAELEAVRAERATATAEKVERQQLFNARLSESGNYLLSLEDSLDRFSYYMQQSQAGEQMADRAIAEALAALETELEFQGNDRFLVAKAEKEALWAESIRSSMEQGSLQKGNAYSADGAEYIWPLALTEGRPTEMSASVGYRTYQVGGKVITQYHGGTDLSADYGTDVVASASGIVIAAGYENGYGNYVAIRHENGSQTRYAHLNGVSVQAGDYVLQGEVIGSAGCSGGSSGVGCHFELWIGGTRSDPEAYLTVPTDTSADVTE